MLESDQRYFCRRAAEERDAADRALHPLARHSHLELSRRFDEAAAAAEKTAVIPFPRAERPPRIAGASGA
ncbi:MAG: hypothetical protein ACJ8D5_01295 [Sphingomicrobium sp.]